jgi:serine/threonine-protein kinase
MPAHSTHDNLLFGLLALQNGFVDQVQLVAAFQAWTREKSSGLADQLVARGDLDAEQRALLESLVSQHVKKHGGDPEKSLAALNPGRSTCERLASFRDADLEASLAHLGSVLTQEGADAERTATYSVGAATSDGQRFRVLRPHARGGLGAVFVAIDSELHREVALKQILDSHADDPISRTRFLLEAEVTGGLEHPGIVPVYGLRTYPDGRPYYAMRFIKGESLKEAIDAFHQQADKNSPSPPRGESRRAGRRAGEGVGANFGERRPLTPDPSSPGGEGNWATGAGGRRGKASTPSRDLELRKLLRRFIDVCNAIDFAHARGILHRDIKPGNVILGKHGETLVVDWGLAKPTGKSDPGSGERTLMPSRASGSSETLPGSTLGTPAYMSPEQAEGDLDRLGPRSDVYSLGATLYCLLTGKPPYAGDAHEVIPRVQKGQFPAPRQIDASIDPALEAICTRAMAFKPEDRYATPRALADDIDRWMADEPVSAWREPLVRRLRRWARRNRTTVTAASVALVAGLVGLGTVTAVQARANTALRSANAEVRRANAELATEKALVQERYDLAMEAIKTFHTGVSEDFLLKEPRFKDLRDRLLKSASVFYGKLGALLKGHSDFASRRALGQANYELADLTSKVGHREAALAAHQQVLAYREALAAEAGADAESVVDVGESFGAVGDEQFVAGKVALAQASFDAARMRLEALDKAQPNTAVIQTSLANSYDRIGNLLREIGKPAESLESFAKALAIEQKLVDANPGIARYQSDLAGVMHNMAISLTQMGKPAEALATYDRAREFSEAAVKADPSVARYQEFLAHHHNQIGDIFSQLGKPEAALESFKKESAIKQTLANANPGVTRLQSLLAGSFHNVASQLLALGKPAEALAMYERARAVSEAAVEADPTAVNYRQYLGNHLRGIGFALMELGNRAGALSSHAKELAIRKALADSTPGVAEFQTDLADTHERMGNLFEYSGNETAALETYTKSLAIRQRLAETHPDVPVFQANLAYCFTNIGFMSSQIGKLKQALESFIREEAIWKPLVEKYPTVSEYQGGLANCLTNIVEVLLKSGRLHEARAMCDRALAAWEALVKADADVLDYRGGLAEVLLRDGQVRAGQADLARAAAAWERACSIYDGMRSLASSQFFCRACCHAGLSSLGGRPGSGISLETASEQADLAMICLRRAVDAGRRSPVAIRNEMGLDPLRSRRDFQLLLLDLSFPVEPLAPRG